MTWRGNPEKKPTGKPKEVPPDVAAEKLETLQNLMAAPCPVCRVRAGVHNGKIRRVHRESCRFYKREKYRSKI